MYIYYNKYTSYGSFRGRWIRIFPKKISEDMFENTKNNLWVLSEFHVCYIFLSILNLKNFEFSTSNVDLVNKNSPANHF